MPNICRLCLSLCTQNMRPLTDCDGIVYNSISFCMHIPLNPALPSHVCSICIHKLFDFNMFYLQVKENEETLHKKLKYGGNALDTYYEDIRKQIKIETNGLVQGNKNNIDNNTENYIILSQMKTVDLNSECGVDFDSEDDLPLLQTRDMNTENTHNIKVSVNTDTSDNTCLENNGIYTHNSYNFKCLTCFETFISQDKLLTHYNETHKAKEEIKGDNYTPVNKEARADTERTCLSVCEIRS